MLSYIFMGSPEFAATVLETLCRDLYAPLAVVTQPAKAAGRGQKVRATAVEEFARGQDLTVFSTFDVNAPSTFEAIQTFEPDLLLVVAFGQILRQSVLALPKLMPLNVHASLLPHLRGAAPIQRAIWGGDKITGITVQKMAKKLDSGDILLQRELDIDPSETSGELTLRLAKLGGLCLVDAVKLLDSGEYRLEPQDHAAATFAPKIDKRDAVLDWNRSATQLFDQIRALQPWPVAETMLGEERMKIFKATPCEGEGLEPGQIATDSKQYLRVGCGFGGALSLIEVQLQNRKRLPIAEFLRAYRGSFPFRRVSQTVASEL